MIPVISNNPIKENDRFVTIYQSNPVITIYTADIIDINSYKNKFIEDSGHDRIFNYNLCKKVIAVFKVKKYDK